MTREYKILFKVEVKHDYYQSGRSKDFAFAPTPDCIRLMENHDLLFRNNGSGFFVAFKKTNGQVLRPISEPLRLTFLVKLTNPAFERFTNLGVETPALGSRVFYFTNLSETGDIDLATELSAVGGFVSDADKVALSAKNLDLTIIGMYSSINVFTYKAGIGEETVLTENVSGKLSARLSLNGLPSGFYGFHWLGAPSRTDSLYFDPENRPTYGVVEIFKDETLNYDVPVEYTLTFKRREQLWSYYLMDKSGRFTPNPLNGPITLSVQYNLMPDSIFPPAASFPQVLLNNQSAREQALIASTALGIGIAPTNIYLFKSDVALPSFEQVGVKLKLQNGAGTLLPPLPLPDIRSGSAEIFVNL